MGAATIVTAIVGVFVSTLALGLAIYEGYQNRKHNRLSMTPSLHYGLQTSATQQSLITIINSGVGPAFVKSFEVRVDTQVFQPKDGPDFQRTMATIFHDLKEFKTLFVTLNPEMAVRAGESIELIGIDPKEDKSHLSLVSEIFSRTNIRIEYQSAYKEKVLTAVSPTMQLIE